MQDATLPRPALLGIDLGTTNSLIAVWQDAQARLIPNALGEVLTPSVVSLDDDDTILVGKAARARLTTHPDRTAAAFKRFMGSDKQIELGNRHFSPEELSALVLGSLKQDAEAFLGHPVSEAVISVPAYFSDEQRKRTLFAAELAGLSVTRLINEPTAAAMAYGLHEQKFERTLIFDLGGGTFDVTVLEYALPLIEVHASTGDNFLGGEDFTAALLQACLKKWQLTPSMIDAQAMASLGDALEQLKCKLGEGTQALSWRHADRSFEWSLDEAAAVRIWEPLLARLRAPIEQALRDARLKPRDLDSLVLVGGATRMPAVQQMVATLFGRLPYRHLDPDTIVALGAATQAACKARDGAVEELILTDVCPYTLGIATIRGEDIKGAFSPIIERNTIIPTSRVERYHTTQPRQEQIRIAVYQGERPWVRDNILIDAFDVDLTPCDHIQELDVRFSYDINGLLEVDVTLLETGDRHSHSIDRSPTGLNEQARRDSHNRLSTLKVHPRDALPNRTLLARLERAWMQSLGAQRERIAEWLHSFTTILGGQQPSEIASHRSELNKALDQLRL
ncbi:MULTISPECIES: molecular chaperone HscC [unclassified Pseudomonas]|jgi:molecular chaperone HscC|uniref:molecular chaperone HscC n=1 Tax=unclassified Pseudomonas TaxID=196821 RepID=UPI000C856BB8|nr:MULTISPECIES: molecular chaperone HscC [unclassified Pseudomonas]MDX9670004.1 Hsp70 family protein [Pseudomonas sp. P8_250]PMQ07734.1 Chaperone protein HscC [Pseudomonas sp. AD21]WPN35979.1 Hsp70 family protein [Pseudomonas sp. P8_139]WPN42218.1 Hsp70 family protein [Pseudomonas sp. P8_229]